MTKKILIGKISSVFGIKGEVKIISYCGTPADIEKYQLFDVKGNSLRLKISNKNKTIIGQSGSGDAILIAKIDGISDRTTAETMRGLELFVNREDFNELSDDEFYHVDLIGLDVVDMTSKKVGTVLNVFDYGSGVMVEIEFEKPNPASNLEKIESFPFKNEFFPEVSLKSGFIRFEAPEMV